MNNVKRDMNALAEAVDTAVTDRVSEVQAVANAANTAANTAESKANNAIAQLADVTAQGVRYAADTGTDNAKVVTLPAPVPTAYFEGMAIAFKNKVLNTGAVTININGLGAKSILKSNGSALASGSLKADSIYTIRYNGTAFILQGEGGEYGTATAADVRSTKTIGTENGVVQGTLDLTNLVAGNIKSGVNVGGVTGIYSSLSDLKYPFAASSTPISFSIPANSSVLVPKPSNFVMVLAGMITASGRSAILFYRYSNTSGTIMQAGEDANYYMTQINNIDYMIHNQQGAFINAELRNYLGV